jgi:cell division protein FtsW
MWVGVSLPVLFGVSMLPVVTARRMAVLGTGILIAILVVTPFIGVEINGARRWIGFGIAQFQPSEFLKPMFIVTTAWLLSLKAKGATCRHAHHHGDDGTGRRPADAATRFRADHRLLPGLGRAADDFGHAAQGDAGDRGDGAGPGWSPPICSTAWRGTASTPSCSPMSTARRGRPFQVNAAHNTLTAGGWTGTGPGGGGQVRPARSAYRLYLLGDRRGVRADRCSIIALVFLAIVVRVFVKLLDEQDEFKLYAASGLAVQFGAQALISMAVNTGLAPSKGMTLPFISYGGSSMIALSIGMGLMLAFTRRNPFLTRSPYVVRWSGQ